MHELGVTFHIMDHLEKVAAENKVTHVRKVTLELGEVSTVIESYLQNCWTWAAKKRPLFDESEFVERFPELSLFYRLFSPLDSEMICIFPYFCPYAESVREIREIFV